VIGDWYVRNNRLPDSNYFLNNRISVPFSSLSTYISICIAVSHLMIVEPNFAGEKDRDGLGKERETIVSKIQWYNAS
jgi:hypothetical protein